MQIKFNTALNADDAKILSKYSLATETFTAAVVSEDGKTVTLTSTDELKVTNEKLVVAPIKTKADVTVMTKEFTTLYSFADTTAAQVSTVDAKGTTAVIKFSEPIKETGTVSLNGVATSAFTVSADRKTVTFTGLTANQSYKADFVGVVDYANNIANPIALNFTVAPAVVDNSKPTVSTSVTDTVITLDFSEELKLQDLDAVIGSDEYAKVTVGSTVYYLTAADMDSEDNTKFTLDANTALGTSDFLNATVKVENHTDLAGNVGEAFEFTTTLKKDTTKPSFVSASTKMLVADDKNSTTDLDAVYLTFSEPVEVVGDLTMTAKNGVVYSSGTVVPVSNTTAAGFDVDGNGTISGSELNTIKVEMDLDSNSTYAFTLDAGSVEDVVGNVMTDALNINVATTTFTPPTAESKATLKLAAVDPVLVDNTNNNVFTIEYATDVTSSATVASNYTLGGKALPAGTLVQFLNGTDKVRVTLPTGSITANGTYVLEVKNVVDTQGNTLENGKATAPVSLKESVVPTATKLNVIDNKNFTVDFSEVLATQASPTGVVVKVNGTEVTTTKLSVTGGDLVVETTNAYTLTDAITVEFTSTNIADANGNKVKNGVISK